MRKSISRCEKSKESYPVLEESSDIPLELNHNPIPSPFLTIKQEFMSKEAQFGVKIPLFKYKIGTVVRQRKATKKNPVLDK